MPTRRDFLKTAVGTVAGGLAAAHGGANAATAAAGKPGDAQGSASPAPRGSAMVARGARLFNEHCATCHGVKAEGAPNWQQRGPDGKFPAPPLNGSAHDWHHSKSALMRTIRDGTARLGGSMPAWRDKLADGEIEAIIAWFQSLWPEEIYAAWRRLDEEARAK
jgi:mono/diheme cytochrome c family protein